MAFCTNCGEQITPGDKFCGECGTRIVREKKKPQPSAQALEYRRARHKKEYMESHKGHFWFFGVVLALGILSGIIALFQPH